ncbi:MULTISPECIES: CDP-2,3-bis-(O-geranylgeranyl)-sn-glycerol synthase [unclassified Halobacterium]|jgi:CDP-2,3-bis-(O-geranylgeranyl)-sn-glycerol synthase|uniref:CDP-2,3-bis-(O-geranylgeranyl)-sn-glycerol synthase n=1 Tax=unclassified Halobacterium TaxID=2668073 RepID=UPI001E4308BA|nr:MULTISPECIES: CDP-2,3-bis-(O-geranylgeranyl)-sn-glycerol synthase [unclassified Halobacterium]MCD2198872.1 CDP-2,3-bis-(O-geranylgeranyl)-sn-glycerol synthase [Halobacterium sp. KA-4]MCD2202888.1 CDP-2,3-bis-(O-geranylgeranyl)-sn-glycerol synthase [Halobacterium sp. KA-6]
MGLVATVATAVWVMLPAYVPNNAAVLAGGGRPIDGGRTWGGKRVLGDGKTWRGTAIGVLAGVALAFVLNTVEPAASDALGVTLPSFPPAAMVALPAGAMLGDILASFLKRRTGRERGAAFPLLDQLDFVVVALALAAVAAPAWFDAIFTLDVVVAILVLTPLLHVVTNGIAYLLGLKNEPW